MWDGGYTRFSLFLFASPVFALYSLFFYVVIIGCFFQLFVPLGNCLKNTKYHSAIKPKLSRHKDYELPHITIQMPVYKEGLREVIVPTIISIMAAIQHYEEQGGTASVFVNDDGMQAIEPEFAEARKQYYRENGIGYTARLPQFKANKSSKKYWFGKAHVAVPVEVEADGLSPSQALANKLCWVRKGRFKKASNMNHGLAFSNRVEDELSRLTSIWCEERRLTEDDMSVEKDDKLYQQALENMLAADENKTWAAGNIRIGELILMQVLPCS